MNILSLSSAKARLSSLVQGVQKRRDEIMITKNGRPAAIIISPEEYESLKETSAILGDQELMKSIKKGLKALKNKKAKLYSLEELFE